MGVCIGITLGDPAGIGPEVTKPALVSVPPGVSIRLYGPGPLVEALSDGGRHVIPVATTPGIDGIEPGRYTPASGEASIAALSSAVSDLAKGAIATLVTGPICKKALSGLGFPGQTEFVAERLGVRRFTMMLKGPRLRVSLVTTHLAIRDVPQVLSIEKVVTTTMLTSAFLNRYEGIERPRIAVLGLNPHASDDGMFGDEEARVIRPSVEHLLESGIAVTGPLPADTAFHRAVSGEFDAVIAMYHDQGLGPLKLLHFSDAINITLGLPRVRCAPDHGPAYDIAGKGEADPSSMVVAVRFAAEVALRETS